MNIFKIFYPALVLAGLLLSSCGKEPSPVDTEYNITYKIACADCRVIYYKDEQQTEGAEDHRNSAWSYSFKGKKGQQVLLFAYNTSGAPQGVTATILLNDSVLTTQTRYCPVSGYAFVVDSLR